MKKDLTQLTDAQLEALFEAYAEEDVDDAIWDGLMIEMLARPDFVASTHELAYTLECWA